MERVPIFRLKGAAHFAARFDSTKCGPGMAWACFDLGIYFIAIECKSVCVQSCSELQ